LDSKAKLEVSQPKLADAAADGTTRLEVGSLSVRRGGLRVVDEVSFDVPAGKIVGIVGLNGAGKSSLLACLGGELPVDNGRLMLNGKDLTRAPSWERCKHGIVLIPERRRLFGSLSVLDNLLIGGHLRTKQERKEGLDQVHALFPLLHEKQHQKAKELSGGQQQMLAVGRGLMARPKILMLDEPSEGLAPVVITQMFGAIGSLCREMGLGVLLAEQNAAVAEIADTLIFMQSGRVTESRPVDRSDAANIARVVFGG
jgi:branched-chain amino acid transport system ATP-binding protein